MMDNYSSPTPQNASRPLSKVNRVGVSRPYPGPDYTSFDGSRMAIIDDVPPLFENTTKTTIGLGTTDPTLNSLGTLDPEFGLSFRWSFEDQPTTIQDSLDQYAAAMQAHRNRAMHAKNGNTDERIELVEHTSSDIRENVYSPVADVDNEPPTYFSGHVHDHRANLQANQSSSADVNKNSIVTSTVYATSNRVAFATMANNSWQAVCSRQYSHCGGVCSKCCRNKLRDDKKRRRQLASKLPNHAKK
jgi:hypothetical protein